MKLTKEQVLDSFARTGSILKGHFLLTSGRHSDTYMQCAKLFIDPVEVVKLCGALSEKLKPLGADLIISPAVGGIIMGFEVARQLAVKNIFAEREDGKMVLRRGFELGSNRVVVVEDVVTTGGSVKEILELCKNAGCVCLAVASIVDRSNGKVDFGVPFVNLLSLEVVSYEADDCPLCKAGIPVTKPGSRNLK